VRPSVACRNSVYDVWCGTMKECRSLRARRPAAPTGGGARRGRRASRGRGATRRSWWSLVSFSPSLLPRCQMHRRTASTPAAKSRCSHRRAHSSPRRAPVTMASHTNVPSASSAPTFTGPMRGADVLIRVPHVGRQRRRLQRRELEIQSNIWSTVAVVRGWRRSSTWPARPASATKDRPRS